MNNAALAARLLAPRPSEPGGVCTRCARAMRKIRRGLCNTCWQRERRAARRQDALWDALSAYRPADLADAVGCPIAVVAGWMQTGVLSHTPDGTLSEAGIARFLRAEPGLWRRYPCPEEYSAWRRGLLLDVAPPRRAVTPLHTPRTARRAA